jgi:hypothetical protein
MPKRTIEHSNAPDGKYYFTDDNPTWRKTALAAKKNSPYYIAKYKAISKTVIQVVDMDAAKQFQETGDPELYTKATHVKTPEELASEYEAKQSGGAATVSTPKNGDTQKVTTEPAPAGFLDGVLSIRVNGILPSKGGVWYIDPLDTTITIKTTAELEGRGGKATGAIVLGTDKVALNTVAFGTYSELRSESKTTVIQTQDFASLKTAQGLMLKYQVIEANNRATAFAAYKPDKAAKYGSIVVAKAGQDIPTPTPSPEPKPVKGDDGEGTVPVLIAGTQDYLAQAYSWIMGHKLIAAGAVVVAGTYYVVFNTGNHTRHRL